MPQHGPLDRDLRIDLLRGLALWMIFADHIGQNVARYFTYHRLGFSDAGEIFIFLSGVSCSILYGKLLARDGWRAAMRRALHRVLEIYAGYLVVLAATAAIFHFWRGALGDEFLRESEVLLLVEQPVQAIAAAAALVYTPQFLDILPLYMALVLATPAALRALRAAPALTLIGSFALWLAAATIPWLHVPNLAPSGVTGYNPFSWQFLFIIGLWVGQRHYAEGRSFVPLRWLTAACWAVVAANLALRGLHDVGKAVAGFHFAFLDDLYALASSDNEHALRLTHFLAVAYITAGLFRPGSALARAAALRPLVLCGRHSLEVFCVGIVLSDLFSIWFFLGRPGFAAQLLANLTGCAAMTGVALLFETRRRRTRAAAKLAAA